MKYGRYKVYLAAQVAARAAQSRVETVIFRVRGGYVLLGTTYYRKPNPAIERAHADPDAEWIGTYPPNARINDVRDDLGLPRPWLWPEQTVLEARRLRESGWSIAAIARSLDVPDATVRDWFADRRKAA